MFDAFDLDRKLEYLIELIADFEITVLRTQAKTSYKFIQSNLKEKYKYIGQYRNEIEEYIRTHGVKINSEIYKVASISSKEFLSTDFNTCMEAYKKGIISVKPILSKANEKILQDGIKKQQAYAKGLINQTLFNSENKINTILQNNIYQLQEGLTRQQVIKNSAVQILEAGLNIVDSGGRQIHDLSGYVRRQISTASNELFSTQQEQLIDDVDIPDDKKYMETSSHFGSRPDHANWQGLVLLWQEYLDRCRPHTATGIYGYNCRHRAFLSVKGISTRVFEHYDEAENKIQFENQQIQRGLERQVREWKKAEATFSEMNIDTTKANDKIKEYQSKLRVHVKEAGLKRNYNREQI